mgnify:CR=1 FL=1
MPYKNKEQKAAYMKEYNEKNKEQIAAYRKEYREKNKEQLAAYEKEYYKKNKEQITASTKEYFLKSKYGMTLKDKTILLQKQNNKCMICFIKFNTDDTRTTTPAVDHCHISNKIRGLLCGLCNKGLGHFKDNTKLLTKAINYLQENK